MKIVVFIALLSVKRSTQNDVVSKNYIYENDTLIEGSVHLNQTTEFRKHYGLSFNNRCKEYIKVFKCMSACKSFGFEIFRLNVRCKCTCHEMLTTTFLPFFKWRTNGTTRGLPKTHSIKLYDIVGTLSPTPSTEGPPTTTEFTCPTINITTENVTSGPDSSTGGGSNDTSSGDDGTGSTGGSDTGGGSTGSGGGDSSDASGNTDGTAESEPASE